MLKDTRQLNLPRVMDVVDYCQKFCCESHAVVALSAMVGAMAQNVSDEEWETTKKVGRAAIAAANAAMEQMHAPNPPADSQVN